MTKKEKVDELIFNSNTAYLTMTGIKDFMNKTQIEAEKIFAACKKIEKIDADKKLKKYGLSYEELDIRPTKVLISTVFKVLGMNYKFELNRYKQRKEDI
ncbi:hypothetical protein [Erysipelothrix anatis]|uniref:hypothetical protein n=1 Tax=Erysipelothrix anatis TaxID=2683713 RepID=UPI00135856FD|nr:hypothetical protein [Erysipelothrix anatis]